MSFVFDVPRASLFMSEGWIVTRREAGYGSSSLALSCLAFNFPLALFETPARLVFVPDTPG